MVLIEIYIYIRTYLNLCLLVPLVAFLKVGNNQSDAVSDELLAKVQVRWSKVIASSASNMEITALTFCP